MAMPTEVKLEIDRLRRDPDLKDQSDDILYRMAKIENPSLSWGDIDKGVTSSSVNSSPSFLNTFSEWFDYGIDEGSADWMKSAYNNSLSGLTEQLVTGKARYDLKDYDPNILQDIGSMALSFLMPLDLLSMGIGGKIGKGLSGIALEGMKKRAGVQFGKRGLDYAIPAAINQAASLGAYEGAMGGINAALNDENVFAGIAGGVMHGGILGGITGGIGGGMSFKHAEALNAFSNKVKTIKDKAGLAMYGMPGQIATESGVFTAADITERAAHGEDIRFKDIITSYGTNIGLFSVMKGQGKLLGTGKKQIDMLKAKIKGESKTNESKSFANVHDELMKQAEELRNQGDKLGADNLIKTAQEVMGKAGEVDKGYFNRIKELDNLKTQIDKVESGKLEATPENMTRIFEVLNGMVGTTEALIKTAKDPLGLYKGSLGEFKQTQKQAMDLLKITEGITTGKPAKEAAIKAAKKAGKIDTKSIREMQMVQRLQATDKASLAEAMKKKDLPKIQQLKSNLKGYEMRINNLMKTMPDWMGLSGQKKQIHDIGIGRKLQTSGVGKSNLQKYIKTIEGDIGTFYKESAKKEIFGKSEYYKDATIADMEIYRDFLLSRQKKPSFVNVDKVNRKYKVSKEISTEYLKTLGVKEGKVENASPETLKQYESAVRLSREANPLADNQKSFIQNIADKQFAPILERAISAGHRVAEKFGAKDMANKMLNHEVVEHSIFRGRGESYLHSVRKTLVDGYGQIKGRQKKKFEYLFDEPRAQRRSKLAEKDGGFSKGEKEFYDNMYKKGTPEYNARMQYKEMTDYFYKQIETEVNRHGLSEKNAKALKEELKDKYINGYMYRRVSKQALKHLQIDSAPLKDIVQKGLKDSAMSEARRKHKGKSESAIKKEAEKLLSDPEFELKVRTQLFESLKYGFQMADTPHLIKRLPLLEEFMQIRDKHGDLKRVKTYEDSASLSNAYVANMSKYLATLRYFPEFSKLGSQYIKGGKTKSDLLKQLEKPGGSEQGQYLAKLIKRQLGIDRNELVALNEPYYRWSSNATSVSAAIGLSSPLSGIKNLLIGMPRTMGNMGYINTFRSMGNLFSSSAWKEARAKGQLNYGASTLDLQSKGYKALSMGNLFRYINLMTPTEAINRVVSSQAGQLYFSQTVSKLRGNKNLFGMKTNKGRMRQLMKDLWKLSDDEISFLEKTESFDASSAKSKYSHIIDKVGHFSHVSTQGGTSAILLPLWMSSKEAKPLTLFQRIATSTTIDSYNNYVKPLKQYGNPAPLARAAMAHAFSGAALYWMYDELLGKEKPVGAKAGQDDKLDSVLMNVWRSEFLGVFGEIMNPYEQKLVAPVSEPIILRHVQDAAEQFQQLYGGGKTLSQASSDFARNAVVAWNQLETGYKIRKSPYYEKMKRLRTMTRKFKNERGMAMHSPEGMISRRSPYYRKLKDALIFGSEKEIAQKYWAAYDFIVSDLEKEDPFLTPAKRSKDAKRAIKSVISHFDPLNLSDDPKGTKRTLKKQFYDWLTPENSKMARAMEKEYQFKLRQFNKAISKGTYKRKYSVYPHL